VTADCDAACVAEAPRLIAPRDGEIDVPRNAVVMLRWQGAPAPDLDDAVLLQTQGGATVPVEVVPVRWMNPHVHAVRLRPVAPLAPATIYTVRRADGARPGPALGTFTTGDAVDLTPPEPPSYEVLVVTGEP
jgi:hypothetical protein